MLRRAIATTVVTAALATGTWGVAAAQDEGSFDGCPRLSENRSSGACVERLQNALNTVNDDYNLTVTGLFDAPTRIAVLDFQGRNRLGADGIVGSTTAQELQRQARGMGSVPSPVPGPRTERTPRERCQDLGSSFFPDGKGKCVRDGVVGHGKSAEQCFGEAAKRLRDRVYADAKKQGDTDEVAKRKAQKGKPSKAEIFKEVGKIAKCGLWDIDKEVKEAYKPVPMPPA